NEEKTSTIELHTNYKKEEQERGFCQRTEYSMTISISLDAKEHIRGDQHNWPCQVLIGHEVGKAGDLHDYPRQPNQEYKTQQYDQACYFESNGKMIEIRKTFAIVYQPQWHRKIKHKDHEKHLCHIGRLRFIFYRERREIFMLFF